MNRRNGRTGSSHRVVSVWRKDLDREGLARALLLAAMHLDESKRNAHKKQQTATGPEREKGGGE